MNNDANLSSFFRHWFISKPFLSRWTLRMLRTWTNAIFLLLSSVRFNIFLCHIFLTFDPMWSTWCRHAADVIAVAHVASHRRLPSQFQFIIICYTCVREYSIAFHLTPIQLIKRLKIENNPIVIKISCADRKNNNIILKEHCIFRNKNKRTALAR